MYNISKHLPSPKRYNHNKQDDAKNRQGSSPTYVIKKTMWKTGEGLGRTLGLKNMSVTDNNLPRWDCVLETKLGTEYEWPTQGLSVYPERHNCRNSGLVFEPAETTQEHVGPSKRYWRAWIQLCTHAVVLTHDGTLNRMICKHRALIHGKSLGCREVWWYSGDVTGQDVDTRYYSRPQAILTNMSAPLWLNHTCWFILSLFLQILRVDYLPQGFSRSWYPLRFSRQRTGSNASFLSIQTGCFSFVRVASGEV